MKVQVEGYKRSQSIGGGLEGRRIEVFEGGTGLEEQVDATSLEGATHW